MPFQAHKKNRARLQSIGVRMLQQRANNTWKYQHFLHSHPITSQHSPASSRQPEVCACMPHHKTDVKHMEHFIFSFMPFQAHKNNRARLQSIGVCMLQKK